MDQLNTDNDGIVAGAFKTPEIMYGMKNVNEAPAVLDWDHSDDSETEDFTGCEERSPKYFDNGARYAGQWKGD